jgi:hypothetical protein
MSNYQIRCKCGEVNEVEEFDIRKWFTMADLEQARDTFRVCEGIIQARLAMKPARKRRKDAGETRDKDAGAQGLLDG